MNFRQLQKLPVLCDTFLRRVPNQNLLKSAVAEVVESGLASRCVAKSLKPFSTKKACFPTCPSRGARRRTALKSAARPTRNRNTRSSRKKLEEIKKTDKFQFTPVKRTRTKNSEVVNLKRVLSTLIKNVCKRIEHTFPRKSNNNLKEKRSKEFIPNLNKTSKILSNQKSASLIRDSKRFYSTKNTIYPRVSQAYAVPPPKKKSDIDRKAIITYTLSTTDFVYADDKSKLVTTIKETKTLSDNLQEEQDFYLNTINNDVAYCEKTAQELENLFNAEKTQNTLNLTSEEVENFKKYDLDMDIVLEMDNELNKATYKEFGAHYVDRPIKDFSNLKTNSKELIATKKYNYIEKPIKDFSILKTNSEDFFGNKKYDLKIDITDNKLNKATYKEFGAHYIDKPIKDFANFKTNSKESIEVIKKPEKKMGTLNISSKFQAPKQKLETKQQNEDLEISLTLTNLLDACRQAKTKIDVQDGIHKVEKICKEEFKSLQPNQILAEESHENREKTNFSKFYDVKKPIIAGKTIKDEEKSKKVVSIIDRIWAQVEKEAKIVVKEMEVDRMKLESQREKMKDLESRIAELNLPSKMKKLQPEIVKITENNATIKKKLSTGNVRKNISLNSCKKSISTSSCHQKKKNDPSGPNYQNPCRKKTNNPCDKTKKKDKKKSCCKPEKTASKNVCCKSSKPKAKDPCKGSPQDAFSKICRKEYREAAKKTCKSPEKEKFDPCKGSGLPKRTTVKKGVKHCAGNRLGPKKKSKRSPCKKQDPCKQIKISSSCGKTDSCKKKSSKKISPCKKSSCKKIDPCKKTSSKKIDPCKKTSSKKIDPCKKTSCKKIDPCKKTSSKKIDPCKKTSCKKIDPCKKTSSKKIDPCKKTSSKKIDPCKKNLQEM